MREGDASAPEGAVSTAEEESIRLQAEKVLRASTFFHSVFFLFLTNISIFQTKKYLHFKNKIHIQHAFDISKHQGLRPTRKIEEPRRAFENKKTVLLCSRCISL